MLLHRTRRSQLLMAAGDGPRGRGAGAGARPRSPRARTGPALTVACTLQPGEQLRLVKLVAYGWSSLRSETALRDQVASALTGAPVRGLGRAARASSATYLDDFWDAADVEVEGDAELQQAVRFALFHVLQAGARAERRAIPAKGLTGPGTTGTRSGTPRCSCCRC